MNSPMDSPHAANYRYQECFVDFVTEIDHITGISTTHYGDILIPSMFNNQIKQFSIEKKRVFTLAGTSSKGSKNDMPLVSTFYYPNYAVVDSQDNVIVYDWGNTIIRKISTSGTVKTLTVDGYWEEQGEFMYCSDVSALAIDSQDNVYISDEDYVVKLAKEGQPEVEYKISPDDSEMFFDQDSTRPFVIDNFGNILVGVEDKIWIITPEGDVQLLVGEKSEKGVQRDGFLSDASLECVTSMAVDAFDNIYFVDSDKSRLGTVRKMTLDGRVVTLCEDRLFSWVTIGLNNKIHVTTIGALYEMIDYKQRPQPYANLLSLLKSGTYTDFEMVLGNGTWNLHKSVIYARCPSILESKTIRSVLKKTPVTYEGAKAFIRYLYGDVLPRTSYNTPDLDLEEELDAKVDKHTAKKLSDSNLICLWCDMIALANLAEINDLYIFSLKCLYHLIRLCKYPDVILKALSHAGDLGVPALITLFVDLLYFPDIHPPEHSELYLENRCADLFTTHTSELENIVQQYPEIEMTRITHEDSELLDYIRSRKTYFCPTETIGTDIEKLFLSGEHSDFIIRAEDGDVKCHRAILYYRWPYFTRMTNSGMIESINCVLKTPASDEVGGMPYSSMRYLVLFFYNNNAEMSEDPLDCYYILKNSSIYDLKECAHHLLQHCKRVLSEKAFLYASDDASLNSESVDDSLETEADMNFWETSHLVEVLQDPIDNGKRLSSEIVNH